VVSPERAEELRVAEAAGAERARRDERARTATETNDRQNALMKIEQVLHGCQYNTPVMREAIYVSKQNGYSQLKNTIMIGELVAPANDGAFPSWLIVLLLKVRRITCYLLYALVELQKCSEQIMRITRAVVFPHIVPCLAIEDKKLDEECYLILLVSPCAVSAIRYVCVVDHFVQ
jgi:hypothetical protein